MEAKGKGEEATLSSSSVSPAETSKKTNENPFVFLDVSMGEKPAERLVIELFADVVPDLAENFRALCTGEHDKGSKTGAQLHYKGTVFHYIVQDYLAMGGDIENKKGRGGENIYGRILENGHTEQRNFEPGMLSMLGYPDRNTRSTFHIAFVSHPRLDGSPGAAFFGKVIKGLKTLEKMSKVGTPTGEPKVPVTIKDCGQIISQNDINDLRDFVKGENEKKASFDKSEMSKKKHCFVFLDVFVGKNAAERLVIKLAPYSVGITVEEFLAHCRGIYQKRGSSLYYDRALKHRGKTNAGHSGPGMQYIEIMGFDSNRPMYISFRNKYDWKRGCWEVTGKVIKGMETALKIKKMGTFVDPIPLPLVPEDILNYKTFKLWPREPVTISNCGEIVGEDELNKLRDFILGGNDEMEKRAIFMSTL